MENLTWQSAVKPSRYLTGLLLILHLGSAIAVYLTNMVWVVRWMLFALIALSLIYYFLRDVRLHFPHSWREITLRQNGVSIGLQGDSILAGQLLNTSVVFNYFVVLLVKLDGHRFNTARVIFRDALHPESFRELCVYLKYSR
jgi:uncharacterized membrane protein AbrB (regulator of aidB expression)